MKKKRDAAKLLPTNAPYPFYDPEQLEVKEPRQGSFKVELIEGTYQQRVCDGAIKIDRAWADVTTAELLQWIDLFETEVLKRALAGEDEAISTFAQKISGLVSSLENLTRRQRGKVESVAAISVFWPVNVTQRDPDFTWAEKHVCALKVGSKSFLPPKIGSRINLHNSFTRLAVKLWLQLLKNRDELPELLNAVGGKNPRRRKTKWISILLSLPAVKELLSREMAAKCAPELWQLGEALALEAWHEDRQSAFGSVLPEYKGYTEDFQRRDIIEKRLKSTFLNLLGHRTRLKE
jgi:hypothetical protein